MQDYKERVESFRSSARFYLVNRKMYESMRTDKSGRVDEQQLKYILEDMKFVERTLDRIYELCGSAARVVIYLLYVENRTQDGVTGEYNITRRQLQYSMSKWLRTVFDTDHK